MSVDLISIIDAFMGRKILVIGEAMLDIYLVGTSDRLCREAPVPVVAVNERVYVPGGAANTAVNLHSLGADVSFLSAIGGDIEGKQLIDALEEQGVSAAHILRDSDRKTLSKQRIVASSHMLLRFDQGSTDMIDQMLETQLIQELSKLFHESEAIIISDYNYGIVTERVIHALEELQNEDPHLIVVDSRRPQMFKDLHVTAVKPNYAEAVQLLGLEPAPEGQERIRQIQEQGGKVLDITGAQIATITLDNQGALIFNRNEDVPYRTYAKPQPNSRAAGAGDTFASVLGLSIAAGASVENAAELASAAASIVVSKDGTVPCHVDELRSYFSTGEKYVTDAFQLAGSIAAYRREGLKIVFTNGCFDILHRGHIAYLNRAKALGDVLILGLNSDESVRRLKGPSRPINTLEDRAQILTALSCVDHIVCFDSDTPEDLIRAIRPDIFVKGGDYTHQTLPEAPLVEHLGGRVEILPYLENHSTTSIIEKIQSNGADRTRIEVR